MSDAFCPGLRIIAIALGFTKLKRSHFPYNVHVKTSCKFNVHGLNDRGLFELSY